MNNVVRCGMNKPNCTEPDANDMTRKPPRHHGTHDEPTRTPPRQHGTHDMPTKPGQRRAGY